MLVLGRAGGGQTSAYYGGIGASRGEGNELHATLTLRYSDSDKPAVIPLFCMTFVDIGRGVHPAQYLIIGGKNRVFTDWVLGAGLQVDKSSIERYAKYSKHV